MRRSRTKEEVIEKFLRDLRYKVVEVVLSAGVVAVVMWFFLGSIRKQMADQQAKIQQQSKAGSRTNH